MAIGIFHMVSCECFYCGMQVVERTCLVLLTRKLSGNTKVSLYIRFHINTYV